MAAFKLGKQQLMLNVIVTSENVGPYTQIMINQLQFMSEVFVFFKNTHDAKNDFIIGHYLF